MSILLGCLVLEANKPEITSLVLSKKIAFAILSSQSHCLGLYQPALHPALGEPSQAARPSASPDSLFCLSQLCFPFSYSTCLTKLSQLMRSSAHTYYPLHALTCLTLLLNQRQWAIRVQRKEKQLNAYCLNFTFSLIFMYLIVLPSQPYCQSMFEHQW